MKKISFIAAILLVCASAIYASNFQTQPVVKKAKPATSKTQKVAVQYMCPMHAEVISNKPGDCPKCGMALVKKAPAKTKTQKVVAQYACSMHPEVTSDKPGNCSKCGMTLDKKEKGK
jgi:uncharacterized paraquat-inducible protein A